MSQALQHMLSPRSIAIVGASENFGRINGRPLKFLLENGYPGAIYPVNPKYRTIAGLPCYPSVSAIADSVDLAIVAVPAAQVSKTLAELGRKGVDAAIVFSSGFAEMGEEGKRLQAALQAAARAARVRVCGPNCLGLVNAFDKVPATFSQIADGPTPAGPVAFVSQSGAFGTAIAALARRRDLGLGYFVNTGNEADVSLAEVMDHVLQDERIRVGAGYIEGFKDGEAIVALAHRALALGKPLVLTKVGRTASGARAAVSHTGSLAGEDKVFAGIARQFGILRARNEEHMLDLAEALTFCDSPQGRGIGVVTQSGGAGVLIADRAEELGLEVPTPCTETLERLRAVIPGFGIAANPVDITGQFVAEPHLLERSVTVLLSDPGIHVGIVWIQLMDAYVEILLEIFGRIKASVAKPFVVCWVAAPERAVSGLHALGIAVLRGAEPAIDAVAGLIEYAEARDAWQREPSAQIGSLSLPPLPSDGGQVASLEAAALLASVDVPLVPISLAATAEEAARIARSFERPAALKIESPHIAHKTEVGGVRLGLDTDSDVRAAYEEIVAAVRSRRPDAHIAGVLVQPMAPTGTELVIGLKHDPVFGVVVMVGLGGILIEVLGDVSFRKAPVSTRGAAAMLRELKGQAVLDGVRGQPGVSRAELAQLIANVSSLGAALGKRLRELDLNPVIGAGTSLFAVDWLLVLERADALSP